MDFIVKKRQGSDEVLENPAKRLRNADTTDFTSEGGIATGHNNAVVDVLDSARFGGTSVRLITFVLFGAQQQIARISAPISSIAALKANVG